MAAAVSGGVAPAVWGRTCLGDLEPLKIVWRGCRQEAINTPESTTNLLVFLVIVAARLLIPLAIPRFPLPTIMVCLIIDGVDQTIFQRFTTLDLTSYQSYDKALDIYYLSIAYLATMRNWAKSPGVQGQAASSITTAWLGWSSSSLLRSAPSS